MSNLSAPIAPSGPRPNRICIIGEAPGEHEVAAGKPFVGPSGWELRKMLRMVGVELDQCFRTNVFNQRPVNNDIAVGFGTVAPNPQSKGLGPLTTNPTTWLDEPHFHHLARLRDEIADCSPNVIIALGNTAAWALGLGTGIAGLRGSVHLAHMGVGMAGPPRKVIPTFHPSAVLRQWTLRVTVLADLEKALNESHSPDLNFDNAELWLSPTLADLAEFGDRYMSPASICSTDVETKRGQITCLSFAPTSDQCLVIPFWQEGPDPHYWRTEADEHLAWEWTRQWIESPTLTKVMQNGLYDTQYFHAHGMRPQACSEDTMLQSHSLYCELQKSLGFLGSIYANVPTWKSMRTQKVEELNKREE